MINPPQADLVQRGFREIAAGDGFCRIAKRLNAEGIPSPTRRGWAISGVRKIVMRELRPPSRVAVPKSYVPPAS